MLASLAVAAACARPAKVGPNGGSVTSISGDTVYAELLADSSTGEVLVQTFDSDLKTRRPIENAPVTVGSGEHRVELRPRPMDNDPSGTSSRFYGQADWARGGDARRGWIEGFGLRERREFDWQHGWEAGQMRGRMWEEMEEHRSMGPEHGPGRE
jgi:hypothetical protein